MITEILATGRGAKTNVTKRPEMVVQSHDDIVSTKGENQVKIWDYWNVFVFNNCRDVYFSNILVNFPTLIQIISVLLCL